VVGFYLSHVIHWWCLIPVNAVFVFFYFVIARFAIKKFTVFAVLPGSPADALSGAFTRNIMKTYQSSTNSEKKIG
jgi:phosphotransferase system  glucose/maltose/N-acetylglucosamine-specific IIC component